MASSARVDGAALLVGEEIDEMEPLGRDDLAVDELPPHHRLAVRHLHAVVVGPTRPQIHVGGNDLVAFRPPPLPHPLRFGETDPQGLARRIELARNDEVFRLLFHVSALTRR